MDLNTEISMMNKDLMIPLCLFCVTFLSLSPADDLISAAVTIAEAASSDHAARCSQADENLDAKVER